MTVFPIGASVRFAVDLIERFPIRALGLLMLTYLGVNFCWQDSTAFGRLHDDTLYFGSAQSLAEGRGYIVPSLPATPYQTKYPALYPWLLSWVWRLNPRFPDNIRWAYLLSALFGAGFVAGCYALVRSLGQRRIVAFAIAAACAFHPMTHFLGASVLSDMPFMAIAIWSIALSARWLAEGEPYRRRRLLAAVTILVALAILARTIGVALIAGIFLAAVLRGAWRGGLLFAATTGAVAAASAGWSYAHRAPLETLAGNGSGYRQTMLFYTDYVGFWRAGVPDSNTAVVMVILNFARGLIDISSMVFGELARVGEGPLTALALLILAVVIIITSFRWQGQSLQPVHFVFLFYSIIAALWNYALAWRLFVLFLPLLFLGGYRLLKAVADICAPAMRSGTFAERVIGIVGLTAVAGMSLFAPYSHLWLGPRGSAEVRAARARHVSERRAAYRWISENTDATARIISYEDGLLYLHTGRQGMRPLQLRTAVTYNPEAHPIIVEATRVADTAEAIEADYWLVSVDDWSAEGGQGLDELKSAVERVLEPCPIAAEFAGGAVVIRRMDRGRCRLDPNVGR